MAQPVAPPPLTPGTRIGFYEVDKLLGSGGMARTYRAKDTRTRGHYVALKVLLSTDRDSIARLEREAEVMSKVNSLHIPKLLAKDTLDGVPYIVMELLYGRDLLRELTSAPERKLPLQRAVDVAIGACRALWACHRQGMIHRDVKPENIYLHNAGEGEVVCLIDFGIAHPPQGADITATHLITGSAPYMGPEHTSPSDVDERCDQFSLAATLFECIAGRLPWSRAIKGADGKFKPITAMDHFRELMAGKVTRITELVPGLPDGFVAVLEQALALEPDTRFVSIKEFAIALLPFASPSTQATFGDALKRVDPLPQMTGPVPIRRPRASGSTPSQSMAPTVVEVVQEVSTFLEERGSISSATTAADSNASPTPELVSEELDDASASAPIASRRGGDRRGSVRRRQWITLSAAAAAMAVLGAIGVTAFIQHRSAMEDLLPPAPASASHKVPPSEASKSSPTLVAPETRPAAPQAEPAAAAPAQPMPEPPVEPIAMPADEGGAPAPAQRAKRPRRERVRFTPAGIPILPN